MALDHPSADDPSLAEDETDAAIKRARSAAPQCVDYLIGVLGNEQVGHDDRVRAAQTLLECAGCL